MGKYSISDLNKRVIITSSYDEIENGKILLKREGVYACWAGIIDARPYAKDREGAVFKKPSEERTHKMVMRYRQDLILSVGAWVFEERLKSAPRWYKVLGVKDCDGDGQFWELDLRLRTESEKEGRPQVSTIDPLFTPVNQ